MLNIEEFPAVFRFYDSPDGSSGFEFCVLSDPEESWLYYEALHEFIVGGTAIIVDHATAAARDKPFDEFSVTVRGSDAELLPVAEALHAVLRRVEG